MMQSVVINTIIIIIFFLPVGKKKILPIKLWQAYQLPNYWNVGGKNSLRINEIPYLVYNLEGCWEKLRGNFFEVREEYDGEQES